MTEPRIKYLPALAGATAAAAASKAVFQGNQPLPEFEPQTSTLG